MSRMLLRVAADVPARAGPELSGPSRIFQQVSQFIPEILASPSAHDPGRAGAWMGRAGSPGLRFRSALMLLVQEDV